MKIAIDLSILQTYHRFRGIGAVAINFINHLSDIAKRENSFVFFIYKNNENLAYESLKLDGIDFETRYLRRIKYLQFPSKLRLLSKIIHKMIGFIQFHTGDPRIYNKQLIDIDRYIQFDQNQKLPKGARKKAILLIYDIIPYVLKYDYLRPYLIARLNGYGRKASFRSAFLRQQYKLRTKINCRRARSLIAISENTKKDFIKYFNVNEKKISVALLGMNPYKNPVSKGANKLNLREYKTTVWGSVMQKIDLNKKPFILFTGGIDPRRKMIELLAAYNNLRARGFDISLVLSGDSMNGLENLKNEEMKKYLKNNTSYQDNIHLMGYVTNDELSWLYRNALAFVFPSIYEGFGLPILEAMGYGCPVITYKNTSITEVGKEDVLYVDGFIEIANAIQRLIHNPLQRKTLSKNGIAKSCKFTWDKTTTTIMDIIK